MCRCTPEIRSPWCGKPGCEWPPNALQTQCDHAYRVRTMQLRTRKQASVVVSIEQAHKCTCGDLEWRELEVVDE